MRVFVDFMLVITHVRFRDCHAELIYLYPTVIFCIWGAGEWFYGSKTRVIGCTQDWSWIGL